MPHPSQKSGAKKAPSIIDLLNAAIAPHDLVFIYRKILDDGAVRIQVAYKKHGEERGHNITREVARAFGLVLQPDGIMCQPLAVITSLAEAITGISTIHLI